MVGPTLGEEVGHVGGGGYVGDVGGFVGVRVEYVGDVVGLNEVGFVVGYHVGGSVGGVGDLLGLRVLTVGLFVGLQEAGKRIDPVGPTVGLPLARVGCIVGGE